MTPAGSSFHLWRLVGTLCAAVAMALPMSLAAQPVGTTGSLTTLFDGGNSFAGNTFDIEVTEAVTILGFELHLDPPGTTTTVSIYYRMGTSVGAESDPAGWTLLGTDSDVAPQGFGVPTPVDIGGLDLEPGQVYGIYVDVASYPTTSLQYTNGGPTAFSDDVMTVTTQYGKGNPAFTGANFFPRQWNGTIHYRESEAPPPVSVTPIPSLGALGVGLVAGLLALSGMAARRRRSKG